MNLNWFYGFAERYRIPLIFIVILILSGAGVFYYYYTSILENKRIQEEKNNQQRIKQEEINQVSDYYKDILTGGNIENTKELYLKIKTTRDAFYDLGWNQSQFHCEKNECRISFTLGEDSIYHVPDMIYDNITYKAKTTHNELIFDSIKANWEDDSYIGRYNSNESLGLGTCNELMNYIYTFNSITERFGNAIVTEGFPTSKVNTFEAKYPEFKGKEQINNLPWKITFDDNISDFYNFFDGLFYRNAFVVKLIESDDNKKIHISGVVLCKP